MPTHDELRRFLRDYVKLTPEEQEAFKQSLRIFVEGLENGVFDPKLRIKRVQGYPGVWEITWAPDGRATFQYGREIQGRGPHIIWRRIGTHKIFKTP